MILTANVVRLLVVTAPLLVGANLAVGRIGHEGHPANALYRERSAPRSDVPA